MIFISSSGFATVIHLSLKLQIMSILESSRALALTTSRCVNLDRILSCPGPCLPPCFLTCEMKLNYTKFVGFLGGLCLAHIKSVFLSQTECNVANMLVHSLFNFFVCFPFFFFFFKLMAFRFKVA